MLVLFCHLNAYKLFVTSRRLLLNPSQRVSLLIHCKLLYFPEVAFGVKFQRSVEWASWIIRGETTKFVYKSKRWCIMKGFILSCHTQMPTKL